MPLPLDILLPLSLAFIMFALGLGLTVADFRRVLEAPRAVLAGVLSQVLALPLAAFAIAILFALPPEIAFGVMILSVCPGGVTSNILTKLAGGELALSITLTGLVSLLSVLTVPLMTGWMAGYFLGAAAPEIDIGGLAVAMVMITAVPVVSGIAVRRWAEGWARRIEPWVARAANALFVVIVLVAIVAGWETLTTSGVALAPALITLILGLLALGLAIAMALRLSRAQRIAISLETGVQNATMGITIGTLVAGTDQGMGPAVLPSAVYGVLMYLVVLPVILWWRRR
ncbi:MAG: bile acid:sodium symporter family protein [Pseudomonadota bacterium]